MAFLIISVTQISNARESEINKIVISTNSSSDIEINSINLTISDDNASYCESYTTTYNSSEIEHTYYSKISYVGNSVSLYDGWVESGAGNGLIYESEAMPEIDTLELFGPESTYGCADKIESIWNYDWDKDKWSCYTFNLESFVWLNDLITIKNGKQYEIIMKEGQSCTLTHPASDGSFWKADYCKNGCENGTCLTETDPSITVISPVYNEKVDFNKTYSIKWEQSALGSDTIKVDLYNTDNNFIVNISTGLYHGIFAVISKDWAVPSNYIGSGYRIKVSSVENPDIYDWSDRFYIYSPDNTTTPAKPTNISVYQNSSSDPIYKLAFDYTTPMVVDYYCANIYRSTVSGQLGKKVLDCVGKDTKPGANTSYFPYEDSYIKDNSDGTVYYTIRAVDTAGNESTNIDQYSYSWDVCEGPYHVLSPDGRCVWSCGLNTTPDNITNECVCKDGHTESGNDKFGRRVCSIDSNSPSITIIYPNGGEKWEAGKAYSIVWHSTGYDKVRVYVGCEGYASGAIMDVPSGTVGGSYIYTVPANWAVQDQCKVQVSENVKMLTNITDGVNSDMSNNYFSIIKSSTKSITVTSPNDGDKLEIGKQYQIKWNTTGLSSDEKLKIIIYTESKQRSHIITESVDNTGSYNWTAEFPGLIIQPNQKYSIYITNSNVYAYSENFYLSKTSTDKSITVISPNGGETLKIGEQHLIKWDTTGDIDQVTIALNKNGVYIKNLIWNIKNNSSISWTPDLSLEPGDDYKIRITDPDSSSYDYDESDNYFSITKSSKSTCFPDGTLIKVPNDPKIYIIKDCEKQWIESAEEFKHKGYKWGDVREVNIEIINMYVEHNEISIAINLLKEVDNSKIYCIVNGKRLWIPTATAFNAQGLKWNDVQNVEKANINQYPIIKLAKLADSPKVYYLTDNGFKKHIPTAEVFNSYNNRWDDIAEISAISLDAYNDVQLIKTEKDSKVYKLENGKKRWVKTANAFERLRFNWTEIMIINNIDINAYPAGINIE